ncbi:hypothetical protein ADL22_21345 [Streptomyces sp. NRRL F-4489]|uniref:hypothetical protein n=1 Tax=Streptomyces sp. NRRL F-4489 TaxID=1609095 RepID=UPI0007470759|nr:hypothetical protein [Streptomyces sp. NRRL F-4489]KUL37505.1 hypothetical protein ADL22_21345 [Streptomyces sp. NRRL F-4489]
MRIRALHAPSKPATDTERPVPRWATNTARAIPLLLLPWCLWRLPFAFGFRMGAVDPQAPGLPWWAAFYVFGLSVASEGLALLSLILVRGWGETVPARLPVIGGRRIPPLAVIIPATAGGLLLTAAMWGTAALGWFHIADFHNVGYANPWWEALATACIAPGMLWGPLVLALTYAYYARRRRPAP